MRGSYLPDFLPDFPLSEVFAFCAVQRPLRFAICRFSLDVILNLQTARSGMTSEVGMHPHSAKYHLRDASMTKTGLKSVGKNHLWKRIFIRRDEISEEESSLEEDFCQQGWNQWGRIISGRGFLSAGMKSARENHLWKRIFVSRDEISVDESSLRENFYPQGWNQRGRIIPERHFQSTEMKYHP